MSLRCCTRAGRALTVTLTLAVGLVACGERSTEAGAIDRAHSLLVAGQAASAVIAAKQAVDAQPDAGPSRVLLASALLAAGDPVAAEIELRRAQNLAASADQVQPLLAEALLAQRKWDALFGEFVRQPLPESAPARAAVWRHLAEGHAIRGEADAARALLAKALQAQPADAAVRLLQARLMAKDGQVQAALDAVQQMLASTPDQPDLWLFQADLLAQQRAPAAQREAALTRALALRADLAAAHAGLISLALEQGDWTLARSRQQAMAAVQPRHASTLYFEAVLADADGDGARVRGLAQELVQRLPEDTAVLMLAGRAAMDAGAFGQANVWLANAARLAPRSPEPARLLAEAQLRTGRPEKALTVLKPFLGDTATDADALLLAARALRARGDGAAANQAARRALAVRPNDPVLRLNAALWMSGRLREAGAADPFDAGQSGGGPAGALPELIRRQILARDLKGAQRLLDTLKAQQPDAAVTQALRVRLLLAQDDRQAAAQLLTQARQRDPQVYALVALAARLALQDHDTAAALKALDGFLQERPQHLDALLAKATVLQSAGGDPATRLAVLADAVRLHPHDAKAHLALIDALDGAQRHGAMLAAAKAATTAIPDQVDLVERLGRAQLAQHEVLQAETTFKRLAALVNDRAYPYVRLADVQLQRAQLDTVRATLRQARQVEPDDVDALRASLAMALRDRRVDEARALAREARERWPGRVLAPLLDADIAASQQQWPDAARAYREALALQPGAPEITQRLHDALASAGDATGAAQVLAAWNQAHPGDLVLAQYLASASLDRRDWPLAETRYRMLAAQRPDDPLVRNNLAMALLGQKKPGAVPQAEQALARAPQQPAVMDTLAQAYGEAGDWARAIETQQRAVALSPLDRSLWLTLASLQWRAGQADKARESFVQLTHIGLGTPLSADAEQLRRQMGLPEGAALQGNTAWQAAATAPAGRPADARAAATARQQQQWLERAETAAWVLLPLSLLAAAAWLWRAWRREPFIVAQGTTRLAAPVDQVHAWLSDLHHWAHWSGLPPFAQPDGCRYAPAGPRATRCEWSGTGDRLAGVLELLPPVEAGHVMAELVMSGAGDRRQLWDFAPTASDDGHTRLQCVLREPADLGRHLRHPLNGHQRRLARQLAQELARLQAALAAARPADDRAGPTAAVAPG